MRCLAKLLPLAGLAVALAGAAPAQAQRWSKGGVATPAHGYWYDPAPRWVPAPRYDGPPGHWRRPPPVYYPPPGYYYAPPPGYYYAPPPPVYVVPRPRYYHPPPPGLSFHFRF